MGDGGLGFEGGAVTVGSVKDRWIEAMVDGCEPTADANHVDAAIQSLIEECVSLQVKAWDWLLLHGDGETSFEEALRIVKNGCGK